MVAVDQHTYSKICLDELLQKSDSRKLTVNEH